VVAAPKAPSEIGAWFSRYGSAPGTVMHPDDLFRDLLLDSEAFGFFAEWGGIGFVFFHNVVMSTGV
jgi:hypothetical protein